MNEADFEIRQIEAQDKTLMKIGLTMLSPESIRQRFFTHKKEFTEGELKFLTEVDQTNHLAFVAIYHGNENSPRLAGVIRAIKKSDETGAELGITIADGYQGQGLGLKLLTQIAKRAQEVGITYFYGDYNTNNLKMTKLLDKFAQMNAPLRLKHTGDGFIYFEAPLKN